MSDNNFHCLIRNDRVEIFRGWKIIGTVVQIGEGEPTLTLFEEPKAQSLTFSELAIIQDNWVQCEEMINKRLTSRGIFIKSRAWKTNIKQRTSARCAISRWLRAKALGLMRGMG